MVGDSCGAAVVRGEVRVHGGVDTVSYQFTADIVVYSRREGTRTADGTRTGHGSPASLVGGTLIYDLRLFISVSAPRGPIFRVDIF